MDLLSQYKQDHPEAFPKQKRQPITDQYGREYRGMISLVMRLSGGRVREARRAIWILLGIAAAIIVFSALLFFVSVRPPKELSPPRLLPDFILNET